MTTPNTPLDCDGFANALADYLEDDASDGVRFAVDAHATSCAACHQLLADLTAMRGEAAALPPLVPSHDLWSGVAERIDARVLPLDGARSGRDVATRRTWARPAIAAAALVIMTAGITHYLTRASLTGASNATQTASVPSPAPAPVNVAAQQQPAASAPVVPETRVASSVQSRPRATGAASSVRLASASASPAMTQVDSVFAGEITKLRQMLRVRRAQLDPNTVAVLEQSIAVIDSAIVQSRAALAKDPGSGFLANQLSHSLEKKIELLRTAALLPSRT